MYIVYTPCDRSTCIDNETLETNRASKRSHLGDIDREMFHGYRRIYRTRSSAVKERRRRRVIIELRHDNIDRESGNGNSRGRINRYQFVPLPLAFPPRVFFLDHGHGDRYLPALGNSDFALFAYPFYIPFYIEDASAKDG